MSKIEKSLALFDRACRVIPGGIYGHASPSLTVPGVFPYYAQRAEGCRYWDADGREFIDYLCGYGPVILGYRHPEVEEAVAMQQKDGDCFNHPTALMVELAERLVGLVDFADWAVFGKNGSDMTTWAIQVAREHTGRKKVLKVEGAYHGMDPWCTPGRGGLIPEDRQHIQEFPWNDRQALDDRLVQYRDQIAAVIVTPFHHSIFHDSVLPEPGFLKHVETGCRRDGIVFILDDIRAGFRLHLGGSHRFFGFEPDLICFSKAMGNGYPLSAALGRKALHKAASKVFLTGSFWNGAIAMAAALACLRVLERDRVVEQLRVAGEKLGKGLAEAARRHDLSVRISGPPSIPFMTFANETNFFRSQRFCAEAIERGVFFHPHHNWFICAAHREQDIEESLGAADACFAVVRESFENNRQSP